MITPSALGPGAEVRLIAPSRWVDEALVKQAEDELAIRGYIASRGRNVLARQGQLAGSDSQRAEDFLAAWHDPSVKAIWAIRGGYGAQRILSELESQLDDSVQKWFVGFSDSTAIHGLLTNRGIPSLHAAMWSTYDNTDSNDLEAVFCVLSGRINEIRFEPHAKDVKGVAQGRLVGGNLSVLQTMIGTPSFPLQKGDLLFIEDLDEMIYHLDRMLVHLSRSGSLKKLAGIIIGTMSDMRDNTVRFGFSTDNPFGKPVDDVLFEHLGGLNVPVAFGFPAGHGASNHPLILGAEVSLEINSGGNLLRYIS
jgi:muramoyltetrapeptide carboxypeptidase